MLSRSGDNRRVLRACLEGRLVPMVGQALFCEYEDVLSRRELFHGCPLSPLERADLLDALMAVSEWVKIYYSWRPNLRDEADNHLVELAIAGGADMIVTHNARHVLSGDLRFPGLRIVKPLELLKELP
ncbi:MAG: putative toxin-antitoxin system toxin component, PIN family [Bryobacteraceae bacterium]